MFLSISEAQEPTAGFSQGSIQRPTTGPTTYKNTRFTTEDDGGFIFDDTTEDKAEVTDGARFNVFGLYVHYFIACVVYNTLYNLYIYIYIYINNIYIYIYIYIYY